MLLNSGVGFENEVNMTWNLPVSNRGMYKALFWKKQYANKYDDSVKQPFNLLVIY